RAPPGASSGARLLRGRSRPLTGVSPLGLRQTARSARLIPSRLRRPMPNLFEDEFTGRLDLSLEENANVPYGGEPDESFPYHYEYVEEWLLVVGGVVVVRVPDGEVELV